MPCLEEAAERRRVCTEERDNGHRSCDDWAKTSSSQCGGWAALICLFVVWVVKWVCVGWVWISNIVCVAWSYVVETVCLVYVALTIFVGTLFGSGRRIDVHCHLMTTHSIAIYFGVGLLEALIDFDLLLNGGRPNRNRDLLVRDGGEVDISNTIAQWTNALRIFTVPNSTEVYRELRRTYLWQYKVVPLLLDLGHFSEGSVSSLIRTLDEAATNLNATIARVMTSVNILEVQDTLNDVVGDVRNQLMANMQGWNYAGQAAELLTVVNRYPNKVFPFLGVDPRRQGILNIVKQSVSRNGPFYGVKLYTPIGFSPTDPVLFGGSGQKDCVYGYCERNEIPVTIHCSPGGFGTLSRSVPVTGLVQFGEGVQLTVDGFKGTVDNQGLAEVIGTVNFSTSVLDGGPTMAIAERSRALNHPHIWRRVLEAYPRLYLNLAHFGGQEEATAYAHEIESGTEANPVPWTKHIVEIMESFENVYADLATFANSTDLQLFKDQVYDQLSDRLKARILYGSDFNILMLFEVSVADYLADFQRIFGSNFDALSIDNPQRFLFDRP
jgi:predicted TIM-barrel fold metal-dependent hydrolase